MQLDSHASHPNAYPRLPTQQLTHRDQGSSTDAGTNTHSPGLSDEPEDIATSCKWACTGLMHAHDNPLWAFKGSQALSLSGIDPAEVWCRSRNKRASATQNASSGGRKGGWVGPAGGIAFSIVPKTSPFSQAGLSVLSAKTLLLAITSHPYLLLAQIHFRLIVCVHIS